jgi:hypothetical protein
MALPFCFKGLDVTYFDSLRWHEKTRRLADLLLDTPS